MVVKKRGLGRGLDALLSGNSLDTDISSDVTSTQSNGDTLKNLPLTELQRGKYQPRRDLEPQALEELAASIRAQGVMQPIVVRPVGEQQYEIIAGERRWKAAELAGLTEIPVVIRDVSDEATIAMALIENIQRENLNPMEEAMALHRLQTEFELTQQQVADAVGKSRSTVTNLLRLMNLSDEVKLLLERGDLEMGHARALLPLEAEQQLEAANQVVAKTLSVRETENLVRKLSEKPEEKVATPVNEQFAQWAKSLTDHFSVPVQIQANNKGKGKITLSFKTEEELENLLKQLQ